MARAQAPHELTRAALGQRLAAAGCVASLEEADELIEAAAGDAERLEGLALRRVAGAPLAWVTGGTTVFGHRVLVDEGVYVPRWQTTPLVERAIELLPEAGMAVDLCTGSGAIALALARARPRARIVASELDPPALHCAARNGVEVYAGDLDGPLPPEIVGQVDVVTGVVPYVPTEEIHLLPRDVRDHEPMAALDGGPGGLAVLARAVAAGGRLLRAGGSLLLELGGDQAAALEPALAMAGFGPARVLEDDDGDVRGIEAEHR